MTHHDLIGSTALPSAIKLERRRYGGNMSPEERDRLTRVEVEFSILKEDVAGMDAKLDRLLEAAAMGRGAWWIVLKVGGIGVLIITAIAWLWEQLHR